MQKVILCVVLCVSLFAFLRPAIAGAVSYQAANYYPVSGADISAGTVVAFSSTGYTLSKTPYDQNIVGVVTENPAVEQDFSGSVKSYPVVSEGQATIRVVTLNGMIKKGDLLTSSQRAGLGMKATKPGYTVGMALSDYSAKDKTTVGTIPINVNVHYFVGNAKVTTKLSDIFSLSTLASYESPSVIFKYLIAACIIGLALLFAFILVSRTAMKGIDALGRNPLSSRDIHIGMVLNVFISVVILASGFLMGFLVLRL